MKQKLSYTKYVQNTIENEGDISGEKQLPKVRFFLAQMQIFTCILYKCYFKVVNYLHISL